MAASVGSHAGSLADAPPDIRPVVTSAALTGFHETIWAAAAVAVLGVIGAVALRVPAPSPADAATPESQEAPESAPQSVA